MLLLSSLDWIYAPWPYKPYKPIIFIGSIISILRLIPEVFVVYWLLLLSIMVSLAPAPSTPFFSYSAPTLSFRSKSYDKFSSTRILRRCSVSCSVSGVFKYLYLAGLVSSTQNLEFRHRQTYLVIWVWFFHFGFLYFMGSIGIWLEIGCCFHILDFATFISLNFGF